MAELRLAVRVVLSCKETNTASNVEIDGFPQEAHPDELLIDLINRAGGAVPHVGYHPQLGPVQTCDVDKFLELVEIPL